MTRRVQPINQLYTKLSRLYIEQRACHVTRCLPGGSWYLCTYTIGYYNLCVLCSCKRSGWLLAHVKFRGHVSRSHVQIIPTCCYPPTGPSWYSRDVKSQKNSNGWVEIMKLEEIEIWQAWYKWVNQRKCIFGDRRSGGRSSLLWEPCDKIKSTKRIH